VKGSETAIYWRRGVCPGLMVRMVCYTITSPKTTQDAS
jgi:hypothetical protein